MASARPVKVLVVGAGIGGLTCAIALRRVGIDVEVHERAAELSDVGSGLSVMSNAVTALAGLGIDIGLEKRGQAVESFTVMDRRGRRIRDLPFQEVCDKIGTPSYCLSRADLQEALLAEAGDCPVHLGATAVGFETHDTGVTVRFADGRTASGDLLIGADGFNSAVRRHLVGPEAPRESGYLYRLGVVPFQHPSVTTGSVRHYWGSGQRFGLIDIGRGCCYWWAAMSTPADPSGRDRVKDTVRQAYTGWADEVRAVIEATPQEDILTVPSHDRVFLERWGDGPFTLLGDAAHPMLATLGQGAAMAMEDAVVLARTLAESATGKDLVQALRVYEDRRRERTRSVVAESRRMSDLTHGAHRRGRLLRNTYFRLVPRPVLARQTAQALTYQDGPATEPSSVRRELSPLERLYWIADQTSPLSVIARARVHGHLPPLLHRRALDILQVRHPLLRVAITDDGTGEHPAFTPLDGQQIPVRHVVVPPDASEPDSQWLREINDRELAESVDWRTGPLLRAVVITAQRTGDEGEEGFQDLLLTASHTIADGKTCLSLLREWIELAAQLDHSALPQAALRRVLPATEDLLPRRHRGAAGVAGLRAMMLRDQRAARRLPTQRIVPSHQVPFEQRRTRLVHRLLTSDQLGPLAQAARRHGTTVHGALAAAMVTAVARDAGSLASAHFSIGSPVDFRGDLEPAVAHDEVGTFVATVPSRVRYEPGNPLWPMARAISQDLVRRRRRQEHLATISLPRWAGPRSLADSAAFMRFMDEEGPINLCLSNVGRYEFPVRAGSWRVSDAQFITGVSVMGAIVATATTTHGRLMWNFSHVEDLIPVPRAERIADDSVRTVLSALTE
ncbi:FAD-dependent monooxygenase [Streptomyces sp. HNM0645]|uniref:FAD-dependent monooxygenase n=1 Tax=Streptomyces sp. HNM0645 TaxID=2782343 RepID=UPI0024B7930E|nr:FAD-dependent monooxygenase [Streptomyces sp. HNM0645]MDI9886413.1 FAD-dependent monooxygenase [Streptomyces sp. HNM0645]